MDHSSTGHPSRAHVLFTQSSDRQVPDHAQGWSVSSTSGRREQLEVNQNPHPGLDYFDNKRYVSSTLSDDVFFPLSNSSCAPASSSSYFNGTPSPVEFPGSRICNGNYFNPAISHNNQTPRQNEIIIQRSTYTDPALTDNYSEYPNSNLNIGNVTGHKQPVHSFRDFPHGKFGNLVALQENPYPIPPVLHCPIMMLKPTTDIYPTEFAPQPKPPDDKGPGHQRIAGNLSQTKNGVSAGHVVQSPGLVHGRDMYRHPTANIRQKEKTELKSFLLPGYIVQVCGPPMAGKSTTVRQAIEEKIHELSTQSEENSGPLIQHHFSCKRLFSFQNLLTDMVLKLTKSSINIDSVDEDCVLTLVRHTLEQFKDMTHVIVFHKCESFKTNQQDHLFIDFISRLIKFLSMSLKVTIIFTTYKQYPNHGPNMKKVEIGLLSDIWDVISILQFYAPKVEVLNYADVCLRTLCLPGAVRLLAEEFIANEEFRIPAEILSKRIDKDVRFLSQIFSGRLDEVTEWIPEQTLLSIVHFCHSIDSSFTEGHLEHVTTDRDSLDWTRLIHELKRNYVVRSLPVVDRLVIHPLVVFYYMTSVKQGKLALRGHWYDHSCNKYTNFLCRVLMSTESNMRIQGRKGLVYGGLIQEWPNVRYLIEQALHCNRNTYESFLKVAVTANGIIMKCFMKEAKDFYLGLYNSALEFGTPRDCAVLEAFLGNAISSASGTSKAVPHGTEESDCSYEWYQANRHLTSAIEKLTPEGPSYQLLYAVDRRAILLHRQGRYQESLEDFRYGREIAKKLNKRALGETYAVSDLQVEEEIITQEIHETIPNIFIGKNKIARAKLNKLLEFINYRCENHPELSTLLNLIGLTEQRGNNDLNSAIKWYKLSYNERMYLARICPENLLVPLNNIAMILHKQGKLEECLKYLNQALDIRRECGWTHYYTALTLCHLSEVNLQCNNICAAFENVLEAERILEKTAQDHDLRLKVMLMLAHVRAVLRQKMEPARDELRFTGFGEDVPDLSGTPLPQGSEHMFQGSSFEASSEAVHKSPHASSQNMPNFNELFSMPQAAEEELESLLPSLFRNSVESHDSQTVPKEIVPESPFVLTGNLELVDLNKSSIDHLEHILDFNSRMKGTLSDDGHSNLLATHEHALLLYWNDMEKIKFHRDAYLKYVEENPWITETVFSSGSKDFNCNTVRKHRDLYYYILRTREEELDLKMFVSLVVKSCLVCQYAPEVYSENFWTREVQHCINKREDRKKLFQEFHGMDSITERQAGENEVIHNAAFNFESRSCIDDTLKASASTMLKLRPGTPCSDGLHMAGATSEIHTIPELTSSKSSNNLSQISSPKIIEDQKVILLRIQQENQSSPSDWDSSRSNTHRHCCAMNIRCTSPEYNLRCDESRSTSKKFYTTSKCTHSVTRGCREPVEQSENGLEPVTCDENTCFPETFFYEKCQSPTNAAKHNLKSPGESEDFHKTKLLKASQEVNSHSSEKPKLKSYEKFNVSEYIVREMAQADQMNNNLEKETGNAELHISAMSHCFSDTSLLVHEDIHPQPFVPVQQACGPSQNNLGAETQLFHTNPVPLKHAQLTALKALSLNSSQRSACPGSRASFSESGFEGSSTSSDNGLAQECSHDPCSGQSALTAESGYQSHVTAAARIKNQTELTNGIPDIACNAQHLMQNQASNKDNNHNNFRTNLSSTREPDESSWCDTLKSDCPPSSERYQTVIHHDSLNHEQSYQS
ncbi:uncharacterized protein LOC131930143 [Physella acuta]|uniref:uncharacterized protein LOC131930143 n=1 Tax=Physella acuta TaxID=109671 RepID=UPI0027DE2092|nr:uncharacterized protein LOC131930143 [Physella acuta]